MADSHTVTKHWYVIHTYSGYEDRVAENLRQRIETMHMADKIFDVIVPKENQIQTVNKPMKSNLSEESQTVREKTN